MERPIDFAARDIAAVIYASVKLQKNVTEKHPNLRMIKVYDFYFHII